MRRAGFLALLTLLFAACGEDLETGPNRLEATIDCLGMVPTQVSGAPEGTTRLPMAGDLDVVMGEVSDPFVYKVAEGNRCWFHFSGPFEGTVPNITFDTINSGLIVVNLNGTVYMMHDGDITFDEGSTRSKASGHYAGNFHPRTAGSAYEEVFIEGDFDYCHMPSRWDCPYQVEGVFDHPVTISAPKYGQGVPAEAVDCRALIDTQTGAMQLDMQIGVWAGTNMANLFDNCEDILGVEESMLVNDNRLRFRVGGVTGPGTYGPYVAQQWLTEEDEVVVMPELEWKVPPAFAYLYTPASETLGACSFLQQSGCYGFPCDGTYVRTVPDESQCTFTVGEDEITLNCTDIVSHLPNLPPYFERGDFDMTSSCRVVYQ